MQKKWMAVFLAFMLGFPAFFSTVQPASAAPLDVKTIFLFKNVLESNTAAIKSVGFNTAIIFRISVTATGDLVYYSVGNDGAEIETPIVTDGAYVGGSTLSSKVQSLKQAPTQINRVEICLVSHDATFQNIRDLVTAQGTGTTTALYKNFQALKTAWNLDGVTDDDESVYHVASTVNFATMLGDIGYKFTFTPYTNSSFWKNVKNQVNAASPGLVDRVYLQCYDGGAGNNPGTWQTILGMKVIPMLWVTNDYKPYAGVTAAQAKTKFENWYASYAIAGGAFWNEYDIEKMGSSYTAYANALDVYPIAEIAEIGLAN